MKKLIAIAFVALTLASCGTQYSSCAGVDGGRASACGRRQNG